MSEMKHTPGEWFTHREGFSTVYVESRIGGGLIQEVAACGPTAAGSEQQEANARLMAAAPELMDALKALLNYDNLGAYERADVRQKARAAIAKATGGQP